MKTIIQALCLAAIVISAGCSSDSAKRTAYYTLQNAGRQECEKTPSASCDKGATYDQYQRERQQLKSPPAP